MITSREWRTAGILTALLAAAGIPIGLLWLALAPRKGYRVVEGGLASLEAQTEESVGSDLVLGLLTVAFAIVVALVVWWKVRPRGVGILLGLTVGMVTCSILAWQIGSLLGTGSSEQELMTLGTDVIGPLTLRGVPTLVLGGFAAALVTMILACFVTRDDLVPARESGRPGYLSSDPARSPAPPTASGPPATWPASSTPGAASGTGPAADPWSGPAPAGPGGPPR